MATTQTVQASDRLGGVIVFAGTVTGVALDAAVAEIFLPPVGLGDLFIEAVDVEIGSLSGAYVAVAPPDEGSRIRIADGASATVEFIGSARWVHYSTTSARPNLATHLDLNNRVLCRENERIVVSAPIIAGAGVTGTVVFRARALRLRRS